MMARYGTVEPSRHWGHHHLSSGCSDSPNRLCRSAIDPVQSKCAAVNTWAPAHKATCVNLLAILGQAQHHCDRAV
jgi:hypothetical protein